ncbi:MULTISPECIES: FprA family A-type flavoprotein [Methanobrevibacter]|jgi:flavorubredoxin|uniref:FprA family A-type flavoprotein n=2 Tax=Methanobacteriaceae TaxID=2159 RepID=UPI002A0CE6BC|nr:FprA family A-type flavoprotein [Methanobacteriaceae archaeon]MDD4594547.1 FprA family A-type flavoprotein [Methanobacteriaceae archaeon]
MKADSVKIGEGVYWVGALDWDARSFHGYSIPGTTYNCYLVFGEEKTALIDNVYAGMSPQLYARIQDAFKQEGKEDVKIDVFIQNHSEADHATCLAETLKKFPDAEVYASPNCNKFLKLQYFELKDQEINIVKTGDELDLGGKKFTFIQAPMLHWPDNMFTFLNEDGILFSNDAFGQHVCLSQRFAEENDSDFIKDAARKYYANLVTFGSPSARRKLQEVADLGLLEKIKMIAPCHGEIWKNPETILNYYTDWSHGVCKDKITVIYDTMHHSTEKMAYSVAEGIMSEGVEVKMYFMQEDGADDVVSDVLDSKAIAVGAPTMMNNPFPRIGNTMYWFNCLNFKQTTSIKKALVFSSKGWGGGAVKKLEESLEGAGFEIFDDVETTFTPTEEILEECYEAGKKLAKTIKE